MHRIAMITIRHQTVQSMIMTRTLSSGRTSGAKFAALQSDPSLVDAENAPPTFANSACVFSNVVSESEEEAMLQDLETKMKRCVCGGTTERMAVVR